MRAPSVERGGGENGWAGGLTGGALRADPEPPTKTSGESCCLEQCRPDAESPGLSAAALANVVVVGRSPMANMLSTSRGCPPGVDCGGSRGYRRCWAYPMTGLANASTMGLTSRRGLGGRCGGSGVKSGRRRWSPWGLAGALSGLDIASVPERLRGRKACHGSDGASGAALYTLSRRLREARRGVATAFPANNPIRPGLICP